MLSAEQARLANHAERMIQHCENAVNTEDGLSYIKAPLWYLPVRQFLGAAPLETAKPTLAHTVHDTDLRKTHPHNAWSLCGLVHSLEAQRNTGDKDKGKARERFEHAWNKTDVTLRTSGF